MVTKPSENLAGILLVVAAMAAFAIMDMFIKLLSATIPVGEIMIILGLGGFGVFATMAKLQNTRIWTEHLLHPAVLLRGVGEIIGTSGFILALALTPISFASAVLQATPLAVVLGAVLFLKNKVGWQSWLAILIGFAGVLIILRPGVDGFEPASLFAIQGVIGLSIRDLATRNIPPAISSTVVSAFGFGLIVPLGAVMLIFETSPVTPSLYEITLLAAALVTGPVAYYCIVAAMRIGEIAVVTPFRYTRLVFAMFIGVSVFDETLDSWVLVGSAIIIASGLYTIYQESTRRKALSLREN